MSNTVTWTQTWKNRRGKGFTQTLSGPVLDTNGDGTWLTVRSTQTNLVYAVRAADAKPVPS